MTNVTFEHKGHVYFGTDHMIERQSQRFINNRLIGATIKAGVSQKHYINKRRNQTYRIFGPWVDGRRVVVCWADDNGKRVITTVFHKEAPSVTRARPNVRRSRRR
jgi:hypothetical protein